MSPFQLPLVRLGLALIVLLLAGCAGIGPSTLPDWPTQIARAVPQGDGSVRFESAGGWLPDAQGYMPERSSSIPDARLGVLAITQNSVLFLQWDSDASSYRVMWRLPLDQVSDCRIARHGLGARLIIVAPDYRTQTFELTGPRGGLVDRAAANRALELLRASSSQRACHRVVEPDAATRQPRK